MSTAVGTFASSAYARSPDAPAGSVSAGCSSMGPEQGRGAARDSVEDLVGQGYLLARPLSPDAAWDYLAGHAQAPAVV